MPPSSLIHSKPPESPLLRLPAPVRARIFRLADVYSGEILYLDRSCRLNNAGHPPGGYSITNYLLVCRRIHEDVSQIFYAENTFKFHQRRGGLRTLLRLPPHAVARLTSVRMWSKHMYTDGDPLKLYEMYFDWDPDICKEWVESLQYLLRHGTLPSLCLGLHCRVQGEHSTRAALAPLYKISTLKDCAVGLDSPNTVPLGETAKEAATHAMGIAVRPRFPFLRLPAEIRHQTLCYTDLISDEQEVEWCPGRGYLAPAMGRPHTPLLVNKDRFHALHSKSDKKFDFWTCRIHRRGYSQFCRCWTPPAALFLVCQTMRLEAERIFFSRNTITVVPHIDCYHPYFSPVTHLAVADYIRNIIPPHALGHLRFLEIVFPNYDSGVYQFSQECSRDWVDMITFMRNRVSKLTIQMSFAQVERPWAVYRSETARYSEWFRTMDREKSDAMIEAYRQIIEPLSSLRGHGLERLFVDLLMPWTYHDSSLFSRNHPGRKVVEQALERQVMGDAYDSERAGKYRLTGRFWVRGHDYRGLNR